MIKYLEVHNAFCLSTYKLKNTHQNQTKTLRFKIDKFHNVSRKFSLNVSKQTQAYIPYFILTLFLIQTTQ